MKTQWWDVPSMHCTPVQGKLLARDWLCYPLLHSVFSTGDFSCEGHRDKQQDQPHRQTWSPGTGLKMVQFPSEEKTCVCVTWRVGHNPGEWRACDCCDTSDQCLYHPLSQTWDNTDFISGPLKGFKNDKLRSFKRFQNLRKLIQSQQSLSWNHTTTVFPIALFKE